MMTDDSFWDIWQTPIRCTWFEEMQLLGIKFSFRKNRHAASLFTEHSKTYGFADLCPNADYFLHTPRSDRPKRASPIPAEAEAGSPEGIFSHLIQPIPDLYW